jgi:hypothetical protein
LKEIQNKDHDDRTIEAHEGPSECPEEVSLTLIIDCKK